MSLVYEEDCVYVVYLLSMLIHVGDTWRTNVCQRNMRMDVGEGSCAVLSHQTLVWHGMAARAQHVATATAAPLRATPALYLACSQRQRRSHLRDYLLTLAEIHGLVRLRKPIHEIE